MNAVSPGLIDTQIARDVVSGDEQAYAEIAKTALRPRVGQRKSRRWCYGFAVRGRATWWVMPSQWTVE